MARRFSSACRSDAAPALRAGAASAGGWATIQPDPATRQHPNAGETVHVRVHGAAARRHAGRLGGRDLRRDQRHDRRANRGQGRHRGGRRPLRGESNPPVRRLLDLAGRADGPHRRDRPAAGRRRDSRRLPAGDGHGSMLAALDRVRAEIRADYQAQMFSETDGCAPRSRPRSQRQVPRRAAREPQKELTP